MWTKFKILMLVSALAACSPPEGIDPSIRNPHARWAALDGKVFYTEGLMIQFFDGGHKAAVREDGAEEPVIYRVIVPRRREPTIPERIGDGTLFVCTLFGGYPHIGPAEGYGGWCLYKNEEGEFKLIRKWGPKTILDLIHEF